MATTFVRVRDPELAADLEMAGLLWSRNPHFPERLVHIPAPKHDLSRDGHIEYWRGSGMLWTERLRQYGYMAEE